MLCLLLFGLPTRAFAAEGADSGEDDESSVDEGTAADSDHQRYHTKHFAVGFLGTRFVPATAPHPTDTVVFTSEGSAVLTVVPDEIIVPLFGVRYWINSVVGLELGIGFNVGGGSVEQTRPNPDPALSTSGEASLPSTTAVAGHFAAPLSVFSTSHLNLALIPELGIGYSSTTLEAFDVSTSGEALDLQLSGFVFGVGGKLGAELSFGFIDVPQLSFQSAFGVRFESRRHHGKIGDAEVTHSEQVFGTSFYGDPWDVLLGSFAVYYYL